MIIKTLVFEDVFGGSAKKTFTRGLPGLSNTNDCLGPEDGTRLASGGKAATFTGDWAKQIAENDKAIPKSSNRRRTVFIRSPSKIQFQRKLNDARIAGRAEDDAKSRSGDATARIVKVNQV